MNNQVGVREQEACVALGWARRKFKEIRTFLVTTNLFIRNVTTYQSVVLNAFFGICFYVCTLNLRCHVLSDGAERRNHEAQRQPLPYGEQSAGCDQSKERGHGPPLSRPQTPTHVFLFTTQT